MRSTTYFASLFASFFTSVRFISFSTAYLLILCSLSAAFTVQAAPFEDQATQREPVIMVKEYTYRASENDSKVSARRAALEQLQKAAIEEVGVHIQSSVVNHESVIQGKLKQEMQLNFKTFSQALTKTKILDEKWNGETFYIKAEIEVDPNGITNAMNGLSAKPKVNTCDANTNQVKKLRNKPASTERNKILAELAMKANFNDECNAWQYSVLNTLIYYKQYPVNGYREFLFDQLSKIKSTELLELPAKAIQYAISQSGKVTNDEWAITLKVMVSASYRSLQNLVREISSLDTKSYKEKVNDIIELVDEQKFKDKTLTKSKVTQLLIYQSFSTYNKDNEHNQFSANLYLTYADDLTDVNKTTKNVIKFYQWGHSPVERDSNELNAVELADKVMHHFLDNNDVETLPDSSKSSLYEVLRPLMNDRVKKDGVDYQYLNDLLKDYPAEFTYLVESRNMHASYKNLFLLKYNLPAVNVCKPVECTKQSRNKDLSARKQGTYLDYLVAYGSRASSAEKEIIKQFERLQALHKSGYRSRIELAFITVLSNIKSTNPKAINLMLKTLQESNKQVAEAAVDALAVIGKPAFEGMKKAYSNTNSKAQQRIIESISKMKVFDGLIEFLKTLPTPTNSSVKYALEDAIEALELRVGN
ncbi:hypothetical protein GCM10008107_22440 [Psychrosphaera saromensis]|uniref:HEAT repeat domain-containing protein n=1 Tax=Psychrosphaera saromensis TaxID=716813 RepID=A0A2S7URC8_9GAMM|nr:hypothetical protein [Psychrosphaera saromensis]PQJ52295.1 hypothetical protein BTO11_00560 [Psychrosphaera saromensis]GHB72558.1 hypothetical protein GCM10008107_22440 [Psychrosphaera saromensis]GLQ13552.1 hypothetical protein GCM10007917_10070 [Psychrosphaera saromensis]